MPQAPAAADTKRERQVAILFDYIATKGPNPVVTVPACMILGRLTRVNYKLDDVTKRADALGAYRPRPFST